MIDLRGRGILITGGASGIGLATAKLLHQRGAHLALWDVNTAALEAAQSAIPNAIICAVDVTDTQAVAHALESTVAALQARGSDLYGILHSAGILITGMFESLTHDEHKRIIDVNLWGSVVVVRAVIPHLTRTRGSLILMGSVSGLYGAPEFNTYGATKAALNNLVEALRIELAPTGIHIGIANPLTVHTPMLDARNRAAKMVTAKSPFNHTYTAEEVAASLVRGFERRQYLIWTGMRPRLIYLFSRYGIFIAGRIMADAWVRANRNRT